MKLIGMLDSPYVRRVAISLKVLELPFEHLALSVFRDFDEFSRYNSIVKAPTLVLDDGETLMDSSFILDYLDELAGPDKALLPRSGDARRRSLVHIGRALAACEKTVQIHYERKLRPPEKIHQPWIDRCANQLHCAYELLEQTAYQARPWLLGSRMTQADITLGVAWRFTQFIEPGLVDPGRYPHLAQFSARCEALPVFADTPVGQESP
ncbi:MAG: glutathione S-transferase [Pseudomonadota bacterium]